MGERDVDNAMPYDKIDPASYSFWQKQINFDLAIANSRARIENNNQFKLIQENAKWIDDRSKEDIISLNFDKFKEEQKKLEETSKKYKVLKKYNNSLVFKSLPNEIEAMKNDVTLKEKRERWHENLSKDIYIEEAINVLRDLQPKTKIEIKKPLPAKLKKGKLAKV